MKTIKLKSTLASGGRLTIGHPGATPGITHNGDVIIYAVTDVPDTVPAAEVCRVVGSMYLSEKYQVAWTDCRVGKIIK